MGLGRYPIEIRYIADEVLQILEGRYKNAVYIIIEQHGENAFAPRTEGQLNDALDFLGATPSKREKKLEKLSSVEACRLLLFSRYVGLSAAQAAHFADRFEMVPGMSYRKAATFSGAELFKARFIPVLEEVVPFYSKPALERRAEPRDVGRKREWRFSDEEDES